MGIRKNHIVYFSDCYFFAGCENMLANFLNSQEIKEEFYVSFVYNYSDEYENGLDQRVEKKDYTKIPVNLIKQIKYSIDSNTHVIMKVFIKIIWVVSHFILKYYGIVVNTFILYRVFKNLKIDVLHINNGGYPAAYSCYSAVIAAKLLRVKQIIYVVNNIALDYTSPLRWLDYPLDYLMRKTVKYFITGSLNAAFFLKNNINVEDLKVITIPNGVVKRELTVNANDFKELYKIPFNKIIISVVALLEKRKGHIFLLEAIKLLNNELEVNNLPFFIFEGKGSEEKTLDKFIKDNNLNNMVKILGKVPNIFDLYNASDIIVLPSIQNEDFPNVTIEAMSMGIPVIGTSIAGIPEQIENEVTGLLVPPKDPESLKKAILKLLTNKNQIKEMSSKALVRYKDFFTNDISVSQYLKLYRSLNKGN